jgi:hypothetical protein
MKDVYVGRQKDRHEVSSGGRQGLSDAGIGDKNPERDNRCRFMYLAVSGMREHHVTCLMTWCLFCVYTSVRSFRIFGDTAFFKAPDKSKKKGLFFAGMCAIELIVHIK